MFTGGFDRWIDRTFVDGSVDAIARKTYAIGLWLRTIQTGRLRQYIVFIVVGMPGELPLDLGDFDE